MSAALLWLLAAVLVVALVAWIVGDDMLVPILNGIFSASGAGTTVHIHLYTGTHTPSTSDTLTTYSSIEATFTGYAVAVVGTSGAATLSAHVGTQNLATATFTITASSQNIGGIYITDTADSKLYGAVADPAAPVTLSSTGTNNYVVNASFTDQSA